MSENNPPPVPSGDNMPVAEDEAARLLPPGCPGFDTPVYDAIQAAMRTDAADDGAYPDKHGDLWFVSYGGAGARPTLARVPVDPVPDHHALLKLDGPSAQYAPPPGGGFMAQVTRFSREATETMIASGYLDITPHPVHVPVMQATLLAMVHSELSEAAMAYYQGGPDKHLRNRLAFDVEMADVALRLCVMLGIRNAHIRAETRDADWQRFLLVLRRGARTEGTFIAGSAINRASYMDTALVLCHAAVSRALEALRLEDDSADDRLYDALRYVVALAESAGVQLVDVAEEKNAYNRTRADHRRDSWGKPGQKKF